MTNEEKCGIIEQLRAQGSVCVRFPCQGKASNIGSRRDLRGRVDKSERVRFFAVTGQCIFLRLYINTRIIQERNFYAKESERKDPYHTSWRS